MATLAIVGRPNVGKSTLFNRIIRRRRAIVGDEPGITRDRLYGDAEWNGRRFSVVDTGGIIPEDKDFIPAEIFRQARVALQEADVVVMVVDGRTEVAGPDIELARLLLRSGKPVFLAVNKIDAPQLEAHIHDFHRLGIREVLPISAEHGDGVAELLDEVVKILPELEDLAPASSRLSRRHPAAAMGEELDAAEPSAVAEDGDHNQLPAADDREVKIAIIGRPNVGKSTLLNQLTASERAIVSPIPGTTRDAVDELVERDGRSYRFIDTAGIRRKGKTNLMAEKLSVMMARKHLEAADIALLVIDATEGVTALDANIAGYAHESGRSVIIVVNKWDLVAQRPAGKAPRTASGGMAARQMRRDSTFAIARSSAKGIDRKQYEERVRHELKFLNYAPVVFVSAVSGKNVDKIFDLVAEVARERRKRIPTGEMNRFLAHIDFERASVPVSRRVKILYLTQAGTSPPTFILFTDRQVKLHFSYERFLENQIRRASGFQGTPIWIKVRARG